MQYPSKAHPLSLLTSMYVCMHIRWELAFRSSLVTDAIYVHSSTLDREGNLLPIPDMDAKADEVELCGVGT